jgi:putative ABC transport system ATP-binding protein
MGPSGSGKSTLLRLLNRLDEPDEGEVRLDGSPLPSLPVRELRRRVVLVGQQPAPFPGTVDENIAYGPRLQGLAASEVARRVRDTLQKVGLPDDLRLRPADRLSVGQQQRVCLARALALQPEALLLDEPTAPLDPASAGGILKLVRGLQQDTGLTVVYVTHRLADAQFLGGNVLFLSEGVLVDSGPAEQVLDSARSEAIRDFLAREATA